MVRIEISVGFDQVYESSVIVFDPLPRLIRPCVCIYCMFGNTVCKVSIFLLRRFPFVFILFTNHVSRNEQRYIFQKMIETSHTVLPNIE